MTKTLHQKAAPCGSATNVPGGESAKSEGVEQASTSGQEMAKKLREVLETLRAQQDQHPQHPKQTDATTRLADRADTWLFNDLFTALRVTLGQPPPRGPTSGLMSISAFCLEYGVGRTRAFSLLSEKKLVARRFGGRTLIERQSAEEWAASLPVWNSTRAPSPTQEG